MAGSISAMPSCNSEITATVLRTPSTRRISTTRLLLPRTEARNLQLLAPLLFSRKRHPTSFSLMLRRLTSEIAPPRLHRCGPTSPCTPQRSTAPASSVKARPPGLEPKRRLTNNSAAAASSVNACAPHPGNSLSIRSSFNPLVDKPRRHDTTRNSSRMVACMILGLAEHSESVTMAFSLTPSYFGEDPFEWRYHDNT